jgi:hypothetical protein
MGWIEIAAKLPETHGYYFICWVFDDKTLTGEAWYDKDDGWIIPEYATNKGDTWPIPDILFWMPLPAPPCIDAIEAAKKTMKQQTRSEGEPVNEPDRAFDVCPTCFSILSETAWTPEGEWLWCSICNKGIKPGTEKKWAMVDGD